MILVIGGAGYIGSHVVKELIRKQYRVVVLDNLSTGHRNSVDKQAVFEKGDVGNPLDLDRVFSRYSIDAVLNFAGSNPGEYMAGDAADQYYIDSVSHTVTLLRKMAEYHMTNLVCSSTTALYSPSMERRVLLAPYVRSQYLIEKLLGEFEHILALDYTIVRYGNVAGADESGEIGEDHEPEMHVIPRVLKHLLQPQQDVLMLHSDATYNGEYLHVKDVVHAHILCMEQLLEGKKISKSYTLGTDCIVSVQNIIAICEELTGVQANVLYDDNPEQPLTSYQRIYEELGWEPAYSLEEIIASAWNWHSHNPDGYGARDVLDLIGTRS